jgi:hypothetical protein
MIKVIAEHSVDTSLINYASKVLDLGCRGFEFVNQGMYWTRGSAHSPSFYCVDIDSESGPSYRLAISDRNGYCGIHRSDDPQATRIGEGSDIPMMTIPTFSKMVGVDKWDLIKMDIEGEEIKVLRSLQHPYCKQISVEFHAHCGQTKQELDELLDWLSTWYDIHNRVWESRHCLNENYWDLLLIAKLY